jgi:hypothetical protein
LSPEPPNLPDPVTTVLAADQVAAQAGEPRHHGPTHTHCENCGTKLQGPFCHACGQHDFEFHRSFGHVLLEALENFFHFDAKFFRNIVTLLFRPGQLTADFNAGKRAAQMPPFRLYLFVSVLFFFLSFLSSGHDASEFAAPIITSEGKLDSSRSLEDAAKVISDELRKQAPPAPAQAARARSPADQPHRQEIAPGVNLTLHEKNDTALERFITEKGRQAFAHPRELKESFLHAIPRMLLFCLPLFAVITRVLFHGAGQVYLQHLVLALHFHTFIYLFLLFRSGWVGLADLAHLGGWVSFASGLWLTLYPFLMFRRLFAGSWKSTIAKTLAFALAYALTLAAAFVCTLLVVFITM